jgi:hypothetical protein
VKGCFRNRAEDISHVDWFRHMTEQEVRETHLAAVGMRKSGLGIAGCKDVS